MVHPLLRTLGKILFVLFLGWHMFAVAVYSIPREAKDAFAVWTRIDILPIITPYMFATSQWQLWNIFAPDPLRRVTSYLVFAETGDNGQDWNQIDEITPHSFSIFRHSTQMKLMSNLLDELKDDRGPFVGRYLELECAARHVVQGTPVRLVYRSYVLPVPPASKNRSWWDTWTPSPTELIGFTITCP